MIALITVIMIILIITIQVVIIIIAPFPAGGTQRALAATVAHTASTKTSAGTVS